jgi:hypothetical protein
MKRNAATVRLSATEKKIIGDIGGDRASCIGANAEGLKKFIGGSENGR